MEESLHRSVSQKGFIQALRYPGVVRRTSKLIRNTVLLYKGLIASTKLLIIFISFFLFGSMF